MSIERKVVFVTGASGNLGTSIVKNYLEAGYLVYAITRSIPASLLQIKNLIWRQIDITKYAECKIAIEDCYQQYGRIDILINNASSCIGGKSICAYTEEEIYTEISITLQAAIYLSNLYVSQVKHIKKGKIFFIASTSGMLASPGNKYYSIYAAAKAGLIRFAECLNEDIQDYNMQAHVVVPCNIRKENFEQEQAVSFNDVSRTLFFMSKSFDNLSAHRVLLQPQSIKSEK